MWWFVLFVDVFVFVFVFAFAFGFGVAWSSVVWFDENRRQ